MNAITLSKRQIAFLLVLLLILAFVYVSLQAPWATASLITDHADQELLRLVPRIFSQFLIASIGSTAPLLLYLYAGRSQIRTLNSRQFFLECAIFLCLYFVVVTTRFLQFPIAQDDAYHDYKYVQNWLSFKTLDYNQGEHVLGYTSHLHLILLFVLALASSTHDIALLSPIVNAAFSCLVFIALHALCLRIFPDRRQALLACAAFAFSKYDAMEVSDGKETALVQLLIVFSLLSQTAQRWGWHAWSATLLFLTRPEGLIWLVLNAVHDLRAQGSRILKFWLFPLLLIGIIYGIIFFHYSTVIPHGALGRSAMFQSVFEPANRAPGYILTTLGYETFGDIVLPPLTLVDAIFDKCFKIADYLVAQTWFARILQGALALLALGLASRSIPDLRIYFYSLSFMLIFFVATNPWTFTWYYSWFSLVPPLLVAFAGGYVLNLRIPRYQALAKLALGGVLIYIVAHDAIWSKHVLMQSNDLPRLLTYKKASDYLNIYCQDANTLASYEPGVLGYYYTGRAKMIDLGGLLSDEPLRFYPVPACDMTRRLVWGSIPPEAVLKLKPDCFVTLDCFCDNGLFKNDAFLSQYRLVRFWPCSTWGSNGLYVFIKMDSLTRNPNFKPFQEELSSSAPQKSSQDRASHK